MLFRLIEQYVARLLSFYYFFASLFSFSLLGVHVFVSSSSSVFFLYIFAQNAYLYTQHIFIYSANVFVLHFYLSIYCSLFCVRKKLNIVILYTTCWADTELSIETNARCEYQFDVLRIVKCVYMFTECLCLILIGSNLIQHPTTYIKVLSRIHTHFWVIFFSLFNPSFSIHSFLFYFTLSSILYVIIINVRVCA